MKRVDMDDRRIYNEISWVKFFVSDNITIAFGGSNFHRYRNSSKWLEREVFFLCMSM